MNEIYVIKRDGRKEVFDFNKVMRVVSFATSGLKTVDLEEFYREFQFVFKVGMKTSELQQKLISTANKLTVKGHNVRKEYAILANRLFLMDIWKQIKHIREKEYTTITDEFGHFKNSDKWIDHISKLVDQDIYDHRILKVSKEVLRHLYTFIKKRNYSDEICGHFMWNNFFYQSLKFYRSYIIKQDLKPVETFDEALLLISILGFYKDYKQDKDRFVKYVKTFYTYLTKYLVIPATPQLLNLRRSKGNLSSCNIFDIHDNLESIMYSLTQTALIAKRAGGIGIYAGRLRPSGSYLMGNPNLTNHFNIWGKIFNDVIVAVNQGGMRKGSVTIALPCWYKDIMEFINCKNPLGDQRLKLYDVFPQIVLNDTFIKRVKENGDWYLVDHYEIQKIDPTIDLIETQNFEKEWQKVEKLIHEGKLKNYIKIKARELIIEIGKNVTATGLPYIFFEDNANKYSPFKEKILCGNLCMENFSPFRNTNPEHIKPHEEVKKTGYAHSCNLCSLHLPNLYEEGYLHNKEKLKEFMSIVVRYMDNIIDITEPPIIEVANHNKRYRTIGIGFLGLADLFVKISIETNQLHTYRITTRSGQDLEQRKVLKETVFNTLKSVFGSISFYGIRASINLAKERGVPDGYHNTKWKDGILLGRHDQVDSYKVFPIDKQEIDQLFKDLKQFGIRNCMLFNSPPNTSTSIYAGTTASIMPAYNLIQTESQRSATYFVFPKYVEKGLLYDTLTTFNEDDTFDLIDIIAFIQQYIDSGISFEYPINHKLLKSSVPLFFYKFILRCHEKGIKTLYYARNITIQNNKNDECVMCAN